MTTDYETLLHPTMSFCALLILLLSISWATAERSTWTDRRGKILKVEIFAVYGGRAYFDTGRAR